MNTDQVLIDALADVRSMRRWCSANSVTPLPEKAVAYLAENAEALVFLVAGLDATTEEERAALYAANPTTLDYSVVKSGSRFAKSTLTQACQWVSGNKLSRVVDDDAVMLLRALEYVEHIDLSRCPIPLEMSPLRLP
jgi:hypothetical protein